MIRKTAPAFYATLRDLYGDPEDEIKEIEKELLRKRYEHQLSQRIKPRT